MLLHSHLMVFTCLSWLDLLGVALAFRFSILRIFKLFPNYYMKHRVTDITRFEQHSESSSGHTLTSKFGEISYQEYVMEGISEGPGGLSRECGPPYSQRDRKRRLECGGVVGISV